MKILCLVVVLFCASQISVFAQPKLDMEGLKVKISNALKKHNGTYAIAFKDLTTGEELSVNEHESFHAASTMKMPVMIEVFKQAAQGEFALTDSIVVKNEFRSIVDGSPYSLDSIRDGDHTLYRQIGRKRAIRDLVYEMIIVSSNFATNMIIDLVDAKKVTQTMRDLGANQMQVLRGVEDTKAFQKGLNNTTNAYDLRLIFEKMATGKIVNEETCQAMIRILLDQKFNEVIPGNLPRDIKVAHKTGSIVKVQHDSGIVFLPDGRRYMLVILSKAFDNDEANKKMLAGISEMIYLNLR